MLNGTNLTLSFEFDQNTYSGARVLVVRIRVSCAFSMRCTHVRFKVRLKRESTRINARQDS